MLVGEVLDGNNMVTPPGTETCTLNFRVAVIESYRDRFLRTKKLMAAARRMTSGGGADEVDEDARAFGLTPPPADDFVVIPEAWEAVRFFCSVQTQWRYGPSGHMTGLDYAGYQSATAGLALEWPAVFDDLRLMEAEVLKVQAERD